MGCACVVNDKNMPNKNQEFKYSSVISIRKNTKEKSETPTTHKMKFPTNRNYKIDEKGTSTKSERINEKIKFYSPETNFTENPEEFENIEELERGQKNALRIILKNYYTLYTSIRLFG